MILQKDFFRVVQLTDLHLNQLDGTDPDARTLALVSACVRDLSPDLAVCTGDVVSCSDSDLCLADFVQFMDGTVGIPWTYTFGNHDAEQHPGYGHSHDELLQILVKSRTCLYGRSEGDTEGDGRHAIGVYTQGGALIWTLYLFDNRHGSNIPGVDGDCAVSRRQIDWFCETSRRMTGPDGGAVPSLAFMHVPLPEHDEVWAAGGCAGQKNEPVCTSKVNTGLYAAMLLQGSVRGVYVGHDHTNDYEGVLYGNIRLGYGRATGYRGYGMKGFPRGARYFDLYPDGSFETGLYLEDGSIEKRPMPRITTD